jgi:RNase H-like domain found in reverse transcriptase
LGFFSRRLSVTEQNYSTFDRELLAAQAVINHFLPQVEGRQFQLWTDHKPLVAAMTRVTPPASGRQQRHLAFIAEHTCDVRHTPGVDNVVADALSRPPAPPSPANPSVQVCHVAAAVADSELSPLDLREMALQQILCQQVQQLLHAPGLRIGFRQVGDLKLWGDVSTGTFCPLVPLPCLTAARYLTICTGRPTPGCGPRAASSPPGTCGVAWLGTSRCGHGSV